MSDRGNPDANDDVPWTPKAVRSIQVVIDLSIPVAADPMAVTDALLEFIMDAGDGLIPWPGDDLIFSVDGANPKEH